MKRLTTIVLATGWLASTAAATPAAAFNCTQNDENSGITATLTKMAQKTLDQRYSDEKVFDVFDFHRNTAYNKCQATIVTSRGNLTALYDEETTNGKVYTNVTMMIPRPF
jgi:hypothetical protein